MVQTQTVGWPRTQLYRFKQPWCKTTRLKAEPQFQVSKWNKSFCQKSEQPFFLSPLDSRIQIRLLSLTHSHSEKLFWLSRQVIIWKFEIRRITKISVIYLERPSSWKRNELKSNFEQIKAGRLYKTSKRSDWSCHQCCQDSSVKMIFFLFSRQLKKVDHFIMQQKYSF